MLRHAVSFLLLASIVSGCSTERSNKATPGQKGDARPNRAESKAAGDEAPSDEAPADEAPSDEADADDPMVRLGFDDAEVGTVPPGVKVAETNGQGKTATWAVVQFGDANSGTQVFGVTETDNGGQTYNLAIFENVPPVENGDLQVLVRAQTGEQDQGGGFAFRMRDPENYYIAQWNPLENNVRFYVVDGSIRTAIAKADVELSTDKWQVMRVVMDGERFELFMNDEPVLSIEDSTHPDAGRVGLWTKADAATLFDDVQIVRM